MDNSLNINNLKKFIKKELSDKNPKECKVDICTKNKIYYNIRIIYKNHEENIVFHEYIVKKDENINYIFHYLSNESILHTNSKKDIKEVKHHFQNIIKFYYYDKWNIISNDSDENIINSSNQTFGNINDFYEILNKEYYYTYIIKKDKLKFLSKGKLENKEQIYDINIKNILYEEDQKYVLVYNRNINSKECENGNQCINPKCIYDHPKNYNLINSYKQYILDYRKNDIKFKTINCKYSDEVCNRHKNNKCIFKHDNDPKTI